MSKITQLNTQLYDINTAAPITILNKQAASPAAVQEDSFVCGIYEIKDRLNVASGESELYLCEYDNHTYVAKVYSRKMGIKQDIPDRIRAINSPYITKIHDTGEYKGYPVEILPYYKLGSLQGRKFTYGQLRGHIIPALNEGLKALHDNGILHKDLKPSNIMLTKEEEDKLEVAITDFGISSARELGNTVVLTQTGMTPEYSAPETFRNLFLSESDYYSMGITIFELYCGFTPYHNMSVEEIEQYVSVQKIPFPAGMPKELKDLINAVTYPDITNRKDKQNPNRRWGYEEVRNWYEGIEQTIPGEGVASAAEGNRAYTFMGKSYEGRAELAAALAKNWNEGKRQLFRGLLSSFYRTFDPELAGYCMDAEEESTIMYGNDNVIFWKLLYQLNPDTKEFYWKDRVYPGLPGLGEDLLEILWQGNVERHLYFASILEEGMLSRYVKLMEPANSEMYDAMKGMEKSFRNIVDKRHEKIMMYYMMGYMLSGRKVLRKNGREFISVEEFISYVKDLIRSNYEEFEKLCHELFEEGGQLEPQTESWLISMGKRSEVENWRSSLENN